MSKQKLKTISGKLKKASKAHAGQSEQLDEVISAMSMKRTAFKLREVNSPMKCWKTHRKVGTKKSPSGKTNPDGSVKMVNDCVKK